MAAGPSHATPAAAGGAAEHLGPRAADPAHVLVRSLAPLLGLDPSGVRIERSGIRARAAARPSTIELAPGVVPDCGLVAHELAHVAQHANRARPGAPRPDVTSAEREAEGLRAAARAGTPLWRPAAVLPAGRTARLVDASGVAADAPPDLPALNARLVELVERTRAGELKRMASELGDNATWSWDAVETALQILEVYDFVTARALARALSQDARVRLVHLNDKHHQRHPAAAAAALAALTREDVARFVAEAQAPPRLNEGSASSRVTLKSAVHGIQPGRLGSDALRGLLDALRLVPQATLVELNRGDRRDVFRELLAAPAPAGDEREPLQQAVNRESRIEQAAADELAKETVTRLQTILTSSDEGPTRAALDLLAMLAQQADHAPGSATTTPGQPIAAPVPKTTNEPPTPSERLRAVVAAMDGAGLVERLLDGLPEAERYEGSRSDTLRKLLAARAPALTLRRIESLLSYKWNDWAVTDDDARFAYLLVRTLPLEVQDTWRLTEGGKWFNRLLNNLPDGMVEGGEYTGVGSEFGTAPPGERGADPAEVKSQLEPLLKLWRLNHAPTNARWIARMLLGLDPDRGELKGSETDLPVRRGVVRRFDALNELREVYAELPEDYLFGERTRQELLDLTAMRDPTQVELHAASLLSTGFTDWWISSREAWTAYALIRSLPPERQQRFAADDPGRWSSLLGALTKKMQASFAFSAATGRGPWPGRKQLRDRLSDARLWSPDGERAAELRALCILARASDDAEFVFDESRKRQAWLSPKLKPMVAALALYDPTANRENAGHLRGQRLPPKYTAEKLEARSFGGELFKFVDYANGLEWALVGLGAYLVMGWVSLGGRSIHVSDFDLSWAQWASGGDLGGAVLADRERTGPPAAPASPRSGPSEPSGANRLSFEADLGTGAFRLRLPELALQRLNVVRGGSSYRTGPLTVKNLRVQADFSDRHYTKPVGMKLDSDSVAVDDFVAANASLPGGAWAVSHLATRPFHVEGGATGAEELDAEVPREGQTIPIPVFSYLLDALANIVALKGGIPFDYTLVDLALIPFTSGLNLAASSAVSVPANALIPTPAPLDHVWGLATDGVLRPPRSVIDRAKEAAAMLRSLNVHFDELKIDGLSMGAGTQVASITLRDVDIGATMSRPAYLRHLIRSLKRAYGAMAPGPDRDATQKRIAEAELELEGTKDKPGLAALEAELEKLERKDRWNPGALSVTERARLVELSDLMRTDAGLTADIGSIEVGRLSGAVQAEGAHISGIHLEGRLPIGTAGYLADEDLVARFAAGGRRAPTAAELATHGDVRLTIARTELLPGRDGAPTLRIVAEKVPTKAELTTRLANLAPGADAGLRQRLTEARDLVGEIEALRAGPNPTSAEVQAQITAKTDSVRQRLGISVGSLTLGPITGGLDPTTGALTATVHDVDARDITGDGFAVRRVHGDLTLGVGGLGGLDIDARDLTTPAGKAKARSALAGRFGVDAMFEGIRTEFGDVGEVTIAGLSGDVSMLGDGYRVANVRATRLALGTLNVGVAGARLTARQVAIEGLGLDAEVHLTKDGAIRSALVPRLDVGRISADTLVYDSVDEKTGESVHAEVTSGALVNLRARDLSYAPDADGKSRLSGKGSLGAIEDLRYKVVLNTLDSASKALKETSVTGTVAGGGAPGARPVLDAAYVQDATGRRITLSVADLRLLGTEVRTPDGSVLVRRLTLKGKVSDTPDRTTFDVEVGDVDVGRLRWRAGTARISGDGAIKLRSIHARGSRDPSGDLQVDELEVRGIDASDLRYVDGPIDLHLGRFGKAHPGALHIGRVHVSGLKLKAGKLVPGAHIDVVGYVDFGGRVAAGVKASGELDAQAISIDLFRGDAFAVRLRGVSGDVGVDLDGQHAHAILEGLNADSISVSPTAIKVGGLHIDQISLDKLNVSNAAGPHPFVLRIEDSGSLDVIGIDVTARLDRWLPGEKHPVDQPFKKVVVDRFEIVRIQAYGLTLDLPSDGVRIALPATPYSGTGPLPPVATLHHILLEGKTPGTGFEFVPGAAGYLRGAARLDRSFVPKLEADVKGRFKGAVELSTDKASIAFLARGGTVVDIANPRASMAEAATLGSTDRTIIFSELGAESIHVGDGKVQVKDAHLDNVRYEQPGVLVEVPKVSAPGLVEADAKGGTIPSLAIAGAHLHLDFAKLLAGSSSSSSSASAAPLLDQATLAKLLDSLQGDVSLNVLLKVTDLPAWLDARDLTLPVALHFTDGRLDYQKLQQSLNVGLTMKVANEVGNNSPILGAFAASSLEFWSLAGNRILVLGLHFTDIDLNTPPSFPAGTATDTYSPPPPLSGPSTIPVRKELVSWNLVSGEVAESRDEHKLRLFRAINPVKKSGGGGGGGPIDVASIELRDILVNLSVRSKAPIPITFSKPPVEGTVILAPDALVNLHVEGGVAGDVRPPSRTGTAVPKGLSALRLDQLNFDSVALKIGGAGVTTGAITVTKLKDGKVGFTGHTPTDLDATIEQAVARNIRWSL